jgi:hypothetical protein
MFRAYGLTKLLVTFKNDKRFLWNTYAPLDIHYMVHKPLLWAVYIMGGVHKKQNLT